MNDPYSRNCCATLSVRVGSGIDEDHELVQLYITAEDIDDELKLGNIPTRDFLLCLENLYIRKFVYRGKDFTPHSLSTNKKKIMNVKSNPANIHQVAKEIDSVNEGLFVQQLMDNQGIVLTVQLHSPIWTILLVHYLNNVMSK